MKFKTNSEPNKALETTVVEIDLSPADKPLEEAKKDSKNDDSLIDEYKKIIKNRLDLIESSIFIVKDTLRKMDELCDATDN